MAGITLIESAKQAANQGQTIRSAMVETFGRETDLLRVWPWMDIQGNAYAYNRENTLPGIAFRGVNEGYTASAGVVNPLTEQLVIAGGDLDVDMAEIRMLGPNIRASRELMKLKALSHEVSNALVKGDSTSNAKQPDGLQRRLTGAQLLANGATSGGDPLSLAKLDEAIDKVDGATHVLMSKAMRRRLTAVTRSTTVGGFISQGVDDLGKKVMMYNDLPILIADGNGDLYATLAFNEAGSGGGTTATSIYVLSLASGMLEGIQNAPPYVQDFGEQQSTPAARTRFEWYFGLVLMHSRAASRLSSISDAAVVA